MTQVRRRPTITLTLAPEVLEALRRRAADGRLSLSVLVERILTGVEQSLQVGGARDATRRGGASVVYVYRHQDGHAPERVAAFESEEEARALIRARAVDEHGNLSHESGCPHLYIGDSQGNPLDN